jgi:mannonate dehydratase
LMSHSDGRTEMLNIVELLDPEPQAWWSLLPQIGVTKVVALLEDGEQKRRWLKPTATDALGWIAADQSAPPEGERSWEEKTLVRVRDRFRASGLELVALEDTPPMDKIRLALPGRDEQIQWWIDMIHAASRVGVRTLCYNWMAIRGWVRTHDAIADRGGALVTGYDHRYMQSLGDVVEPNEFTENQLWDGLSYFLNAVIPHAEAAGIVLGMHPDDPPLPIIRGIPRIMRSVENYDRLLSLSDSPSNGITFCQGNFALMTSDLPPLIERWGTRIKFIHLRDVSGTVEEFQETFHDAGPTDLSACVQAYVNAGVSGILRPDHVPTLAGEDNSKPGYGVLGRLHAIGYIQGLLHSATPNRNIS